jgi:hypothetical protein
MALPYKEGSAFVVPLRNGGYGRGVVARASPKGRVLFGYFFGPRLTNASSATVEGLHPENAVLRVMFGDLGLMQGSWQVYAQIPDWDRTKWEMPDFIRHDGYSKKGWLVRYADDDPNRTDTQLLIDFDPSIPRDSLSGFGAVEIKLSRLLGRQPHEEGKGAVNSGNMPELSQMSQMQKVRYPIHHYLYFGDKAIGKGVAQLLRGKGYLVDDRLGADEKNWLVLVKSNAIPSQSTIVQQEKLFQQIAEDNGGEYDGWEADTTTN